MFVSIIELFVQTDLMGLQSKPLNNLVSRYRRDQM